MPDPQKPPRSPIGGPLLPALERLAPVPALAAVAAQIADRTRAGDVVLELHGRGGWVTRSAIDQLRRAFTIETTALTRLVAEVVLRPPDLRHLDAAVSAIAVDAHGTDGGLRLAIEGSYASRCPTCGGSVTVDEFIWDAEASDPSRRSFRCPRCRDGRSESRPIAGGPGRPLSDARRGCLRGTRVACATASPRPRPATRCRTIWWTSTRRARRSRWRRSSSASRRDLRAPSVQAALRLAIVHMTLPGQPAERLPGTSGGPAHQRRPGARLELTPVARAERLGRLRGGHARRARLRPVARGGRLADAGARRPGPARAPRRLGQRGPALRDAARSRDVRPAPAAGRGTRAPGRA